jgi:phosphonate transport system substrate-binding protein
MSKRMSGLKIFIYAAVIIILLGQPLCAQETLKLQVYPYLSASDLLKRFAPLTEFLSRVSGKRVICNISRDYSEHIDLIGMDKVDIAYIGPTSYVKMTQKYGQKQILARIEISGSSSYRGVIVARNDSPAIDLKNLYGRSFAFGDPNSTMGYLFPLKMLREAGVHKRDLLRHNFLNSDQNVALGVLMGDYDAGAMKEEVYHKLKERGLKALAWTPRVSEHMFIASLSVPKDLAASLRNALLTLTDKSILSSVKDNATAFVPADDRDYDNLREMLTSMEQTEQ